jgi:hypothetical protein
MRWIESSDELTPWRLTLEVRPDDHLLSPSITVPSIHVVSTRVYTQPRTLVEIFSTSDYGMLK